jgi:putative hydrolase of the HAD superfamily
MFYLSNMPVPFADELERRHDIVRRFDNGVISGRVGMVRPRPEIFAMAAQRFGALPGDLVFLDDRLANVLAARAAGWNALQFTGAAEAERAFRAAGWWPD